MKKIAQISLLVFCALVLVAVPVLTVFSAPADYSIYENRLLAARPAFSLPALFSGEYFAAWENYLRDHVWQRDAMLTLDARLDTAVGRPFVNEVLTAEEALLPYVAGINPDTVAADAAVMADELAALTEQVAAYGGVFLYVCVPNQYSVYRESYPSYMRYIAEGLDAAQDAFFTALDARGVAYLNMNEAFSHAGDNYFRTDHHMNLPGSVETCRVIFEELRARGVSIPDHLGEISYRTLPNPFYGSRGRKLYGLAALTEQVVVFDKTPEVAFARQDPGASAAAELITLPETDTEPVTYGMFMGGDMAETVIETARDTLCDALIFGDSYTNAIETVFYTGFDETRSLDLRYYDAMALSEYIALNQPDVVVCVRDDANILNFTGNGQLR